MASEYQHFIKGIEYFSMTSNLKHFRQLVEKGTGVPVERLEVNAALFLDDVAKHIGLSDERRREVLGKSAASFVDGVKDDQVKPC